MNVYIFNWRDIKHPLAGGAEQSLWEHAKYWQKKGAKIHWFSSSFVHAPDSEIIDGIEVTRKGSHFTVHLHAFFSFLRRRFTEEDIIIDSFHFLPFFTPLYIKHAKKIALINETARGVWFKNLPLPFSLIGYLIEPFFFLFYKKLPFITGSESAKKEVMKMGIPGAHISVVHHGFYPPEKTYQKKKEKNPTILFLSRLTPDKGIEDAIRAVALLKKRIPELQFWIGGKAETEEYEGKIKQMVINLQVSQITTFFGFVSEKQKYELYAKAWVLVHPSIREGWGLNIIEANACGTAAVGYTVAGLVDSIKNGETGLLVGEVDYKNLADGLYQVLTDHELRGSLEGHARDWSKKFSWEKAGSESWQVITRKSHFS